MEGASDDISSIFFFSGIDIVIQLDFTNDENDTLAPRF